MRTCRPSIAAVAGLLPTGCRHPRCVGRLSKLHRVAPHSSCPFPPPNPSSSRLLRCASLKWTEPHRRPFFPSVPPPLQSGAHRPLVPSGDLRSKSAAGPSFPTPESKLPPSLHPLPLTVCSHLRPSSSSALHPSSLPIPPSCCRTHQSSSSVTGARLPHSTTTAPTGLCPRHRPTITVSFRSSLLIRRLSLLTAMWPPRGDHRRCAPCRARWTGHSGRGWAARTGPLSLVASRASWATTPFGLRLWAEAGPVLCPSFHFFIFFFISRNF
jgi:hypothetical protein